MRVEAGQGALLVQVGKRFAGPEVARLSEAFAAFAPVSRVTLDFTGVETIEEAAVVSLASVFRALHGARLLVRGLTQEQRRMFKCLGVEKVEMEEATEAAAKVPSTRSKGKSS